MVQSLGHFVRTDEETIDALARELPVRKDDVVLDIGCGDGAVLLGLSERTGCRAVGVEVDAELCQKAQQEASARGLSEKLVVICSPIEVVTIQRLFQVHKVSVAYVYCLNVAQHQLVIALLQSLLARGVHVVSKTFELPLARFGPPQRTFPNPDSDAGLMDLLSPGCTLTLHFYEGKRPFDDAVLTLEIVQVHPLMLQQASARLRADKDLVLAAVREGGLALQYAASSLQRDEEVVLAAIRQNPDAVKFASREVLGRMEVAICIKERKPCLLHLFPKSIRERFQMASMGWCPAAVASAHRSAAAAPFGKAMPCIAVAKGPSGPGGSCVQQRSGEVQEGAAGSKVAPKPKGSAKAKGAPKAKAKAASKDPSGDKVAPKAKAKSKAASKAKAASKDKVTAEGKVAPEDKAAPGAKVESIACCKECAEVKEAEKAADAPHQELQTTGKWNCPSCLFDNDASATVCDFCDSVRGGGCIDRAWQGMDMSRDKALFQDRRPTGTCLGRVFVTDGPAVASGWHLPIAGERPVLEKEEGAWMVPKGFQLWHRQSDDTLHLFNFHENRYHALFLRQDPTPRWAEAPTSMPLAK